MLTSTNQKQILSVNSIDLINTSSCSTPSNLMISSIGSSSNPSPTGGLYTAVNDFFSVNAANSNAIALINNSIPCTTPIIGQKRSQRRSSNTTSFSNKSAGASPLLSSNTNPIITTNQINNLTDLSTNSNFNSTTILSSFSTNSNSTSTTANNINNQSFLSNGSSSPLSNTINKTTLSCVNSSGSSSLSASSSSCKVNVPKAPKPQRTLILFENVIIGLNLSINDLKAKVADLTLAVTNGYNAMAKQLLQSEAYLRHLEQRSSTLSKLQNSYNIHLKMKDGIQNMYEAYKKSPGNQYKNLANIKVGWKDCIQKLCAIEAQTEALLGTFQFQIEKLIGFARLCPGDTYEIQIKYGTGAKFRTRTKIGKDGSQLWDNSNFSFKITVHDLLTIRINEIKFLGKNILIGERICDTKDLFSTTHTQRLTINANTSGTLKLSILITWLPFENCEESFIYYNPTQYLTMNKEKRLSSYTMTKLATNSPNTNADYINNTLQMRSLGSSNQSSINNDELNRMSNNHNVLTAIIDADDNESESSSASSSTSSSSTSGSSSGNSSSSNTSTHKKETINKIEQIKDVKNDKLEDNTAPILAQTSTATSSSSSSSTNHLKSSSILITPVTSSAISIANNDHSTTNSNYNLDNIDNRYSVNSISSSRSNLSNFLNSSSQSHNSSSAILNESDSGPSASVLICPEVEKLLCSLLDKLVENIQNSNLINETKQKENVCLVASTTTNIIVKEVNNLTMNDTEKNDLDNLKLGDDDQLNNINKVVALAEIASFDSTTTTTAECKNFKVEIRKLEKTLMNSPNNSCKLKQSASFAPGDNSKPTAIEQTCFNSSDNLKQIENSIRTTNNGQLGASCDIIDLGNVKQFSQITKQQISIQLEDLFMKLQYKLDNLRAQYIELNEFYEQIQLYEDLISKLVNKYSSNRQSLNESGPSMNQSAKLLKKESITAETVNETELLFNNNLEIKSQEPIEETRTSEDAKQEDDANISLFLDDVLQYFDFLNAENEDEVVDFNQNNSQDKSLANYDNSEQTTTSNDQTDTDLNLLETDLKLTIAPTLLDDSNQNLKLPESNLINIDVSSLPSFDYHLFLIIHFVQCIRLLDELSFLCKSQTETSSYRLNQFESIIFDRLNIQTFILKNFLNVLSEINNETFNVEEQSINNKEQTDNTISKQIITKILNTSFKDLLKCDQTPTSFKNNDNEETDLNDLLKTTSTINEIKESIWSKTLNQTNLLLNDTDCILCVKRNVLISNLKNHNFLVLNKLLSKFLLNNTTKKIFFNDSSLSLTIPDELINSSISIYHFTIVLDLIENENLLFKQIENELKCLNESLFDWLNEFVESDDQHKRLLDILNNKIFLEILLNLLIKLAVESNNENNLNLTEIFLEKLVDLNSSKTIDGLLSQTFDSYFYILDNQNNLLEECHEWKILKFLLKILKNFKENKSEILIDQSLFDYIKYQIQSSQSK